MCRVGKPVSSLLSFLTLQINIMAIQSKKIVQELKSLFAGIDVGADELILVIRKNGTPYKPQKFANTPADRARLVKKLIKLPCMIEFNEMLYRRLSKVSRFTGKAVAP